MSHPPCTLYPEQCAVCRAHVKRERYAPVSWWRRDRESGSWRHAITLAAVSFVAAPIAGGLLFWDLKVAGLFFGTGLVTWLIQERASGGEQFHEAMVMRHRIDRCEQRLKALDGIDDDYQMMTDDEYEQWKKDVEAHRV